MSLDDWLNLGTTGTLGAAGAAVYLGALQRQWRRPTLTVGG
jgi:hypothetical protein